MIIYIFDEDWPDTTKKFGIPFLHQAVGSLVKKRVIRHSLPLLSVAMQILGMTNGKPGSIYQLRLLAHGNTGVVKLGAEKLESHNASHFGVLKGFFKSYREGGSGIEIHSCGSASDNWLTVDRLGRPVRDGTPTFSGRGVNFLTSLARATDTKVTGSFHFQYHDPNHHALEGLSALTVYPDGKKQWRFRD